MLVSFSLLRALNIPSDYFTPILLVDCYVYECVYNVYMQISIKVIVILNFFDKFNF